MPIWPRSLAARPFLSFKHLMLSSSEGSQPGACLNWGTNNLEVIQRVTGRDGQQNKDCAHTDKNEARKLGGLWAEKKQLVRCSRHVLLLAF